MSISDFIRQGSYRFEAKTGLRPTDFYVGQDQKLQLMMDCHKMFAELRPSSGREQQDCMPSEFMGMRPHVVEDDSYLAFGVKVEL